MYDGAATIVLEAGDVASSVEFYQRVLGFTLEGWWHPERCGLAAEAPVSLVDSWAELSAGSTRVRLRPLANGREAAAADVALEVSDLDVLHRRVAEQRRELARPATGLDGRRRFSVVDPDGHRWSLVQA